MYIDLTLNGFSAATSKMYNGRGIPGVSALEFLMAPIQPILPLAVYTVVLLITYRVIMLSLGALIRLVELQEVNTSSAQLAEKIHADTKQDTDSSSI